MKLSKLRWLSALAIFAGISGIIGHLLITDDAQYKATEIVVESPTEPPIIEAKEQQIVALTIKLADLQSQILRLNALGDRLAEEANIPQKEFNFAEMPPSGGPTEHTQASNLRSLDELVGDITLLEHDINFEEKQLKLLESITLGHHIENSSYLSGRPITKGWLSSYFGMRKDPFNGRPAMHKGVDFAGKEDAPIIATGAGIVTWSSERYGYGQLIEIDHGKGLKTRYGHNKEILVKVGDVVRKGQIIARMGSTGRSTGPHVHYEILRNNVQINPIKYVYRKAK